MRLDITDATVDLDHRCVERPDGTVALSPREGALLARLATTPGQDVSRDELVAAVWGDAPVGARAIDTLVRRLRTKLGEPRPPRHLLTAQGVGYRWVPAREAPPAPTVATPTVPIPGGRLDLDALRFVPTDGPAVALTKLEGDLLALLASGRMVPRTSLLRELWGRGKHGRSLDAAVARLRRKIDGLVTIHGQGFRLRRLDRMATLTGRTNLRHAATTFVPRPEVDALLAMGPGLVTLVGPAGVGKTRVASQAAWRHLQDPMAQAWWCDLRSASASGMATRLATALGLSPSDRTEQRVGAALARRPTGSVVVLDDVEHLVDTAGPRIAAWAARAPGIRWWVTSRRPLGVPTERCLAVPTMDDDAGRRLFAERTEQPASPEVDAIVARLDGLPLAIELAAARVAHLGVAGVLERLERQLDVLVRAPEQLSSQHSTLRGALDWSWDLLDASDQALLATASVFAGPFSDAQASAVLPGDHVVPRLSALARRSLVTPRGMKWTLLTSIGAYATEKRAILGLDAEARGRHAAAHAELAGRASGAKLVALLPELLAALQAPMEAEERGAMTLDAARALELCGRFARRIEILEGAIEARPSAPMGGRLRTYLGRTHLGLGQPREARAAAQAGLQVAPGGRVEAGLHHLLGIVERNQGHHDIAIGHLRTAVVDWEVAGDPRAVEGRVDLARSLQALGRPELAGKAMDRALTQVEALGDPSRIGRVVMAVQQGGGRSPEGLARARRALRILRAHQGDDPDSGLLFLEGQLAVTALDRDGALRSFARSRLLALEEGREIRARHALEQEALLLLARGDLDQAEERLTQAQTLPVEAPGPAASMACTAGVLAHLRGDAMAAVACHERAAALVARADYPSLGHLLAGFRAVAHADAGQAEAAQRALEEARAASHHALPGDFLDLAAAIVGGRVAVDLEAAARAIDTEVDVALMARLADR